MNIIRPNLRKKLSQIVFCSLDIETTGINPAFHEIVEIGIVKFSLEKEFSKYHSLVNPGIPIPENVLAIHGITDEMVSGAPPIKLIINDILNFTKGCVLVIHNPEFDLSFLDMAIRSSGRDVTLEALDTVRLSRAVFPNMFNHKLSTLSSYFGLGPANHRALGDAEACMELFRIIVKKIDADSKMTLSLLLKLHGNQIGPKIVRKIRPEKLDAPGIKIGKPVKIRYVDSSGAETIREIVPIEFVRYGKKNYLVANCFLRNEKRFFKVDRIAEILN